MEQTSNWSEIDREINKSNGFEDTVCFFEDNFEDNMSLKSIDHLDDTKEYIKCLETKLQKLKGDSKNTNQSKDLIKSLASVKEDTIRNFLNDDGSIDQSIEMEPNVLNNTNYLDKKIHPERQALTTDEQQLLLQADILALRLSKQNEKNQEIKPDDAT